MRTILFTGALLFLKAMILPNLDLLIWMTIAIVLDFVTGILKAIVLKQARTSFGYRATVKKFTEYGGSIAAGIILSNGIIGKTGQHPELLQYVNDGLVIYIIFIEVTSVFENIYACDQDSKFAKLVISPILKILTFQLKGTPLTPISNEKI